MISKNSISEIKSLHQLKQRRQQGLFIAEGLKVVNELLMSGLKVKQIACLPDYSSHIQDNNSGYELIIISEKELSKISALQTPNQVIAIAEIPIFPPPDFKSKKNILVLDGIRDPGNMGTLIRTAEWFGIQNILCSEDCVDVYNPKVVQGAMGSLFRCEIRNGNLKTWLEEAQQEGYYVLGAAVNGQPISVLSLKSPWMLVIGSESHGISEQVIPALNGVASISRAEDVLTESLNAAVAAGILLSALSQKKATK